MWGAKRVEMGNNFEWPLSMALNTSLFSARRLVESIPREVVELGEGEVKWLDEDHFVVRLGNGKIAIYSIEVG